MTLIVLARQKWDRVVGEILMVGHVGYDTYSDKEVEELWNDIFNEREV